MQELSRGSVDPKTSGGSAELLCVEVAGQSCALPLSAVVEIHESVQLAPLPGAPEVVIGLVNRRGRALPVIDLRRRLGLPSRPTQPDDRLVVLRLPGREVALQVDAAVDVVSVSEAAVDEAVVQMSDAVLSQGVAVLPDGLLLVLDVGSFLSGHEAAALQAALAHVDAAASS